MKKIYKVIQKEKTVVYLKKGALQDIDSILKEYKHTSYLLLSDKTSFNLFSEKVLGKIKKLSVPLFMYQIEGGEKSKSLDELTNVLEFMLSKKMDRKSAIIALGGGVTGDLATVVSGLYQRGIDCIQIPTTLLSQVDSAYGGKGAVNSKFGKNAIGLFKQPIAIIVDPLLLGTLPEKQISSGIGEAIKYAFAVDSKFFEKLSTFDKPKSFILEDLIKRCSVLKMKMIEQDPLDIKDERAILNFGHTLGHAVELLAHIPHGEAVSIGMAFAIRASRELGILAQKEAESAISVLKKFGLPISISGIKQEEVLNLMKSDKKAINGQPKFVLLEKIGKGLKPQTIPDEILQRVLNETVL